ncbi:Histone H2AX [Chytriomyces hyalinus]|nr:Histone H2AX [Chytriomyces hyalinus]
MTSGRFTQSQRAGILFPAKRIHRYLKRGRYSKRVGAGSSVYLAAVLEYLVAEILDLSGKAAQDNSRVIINSRFLTLGIRNDTELADLLATVTISEGGVLPFIHPNLLLPSPGAQAYDSRRRIVHDDE